jgi:DNA-binding LytR/AlgR family response regulator
MKLIENHLPAKDFIRIHKSFIVCKDAIQSIASDSITIKDKSFPIGNSHRAAVFEEFLNSKLIKR